MVAAKPTLQKQRGVVASWNLGHHYKCASRRRRRDLGPQCPHLFLHSKNLAHDFARSEPFLWGSTACHCRLCWSSNGRKACCPAQTILYHRFRTIRHSPLVRVHCQFVFCRACTVRWLCTKDLLLASAP